LRADGEGFEPLSLNDYHAKRLPQSQNASEAESEALCPDSDLHAVVEAWPALPEAIKARILAMIRTAQ
jgi:hypothetical protein